MAAAPDPPGDGPHEEAGPAFRSLFQGDAARSDDSTVLLRLYIAGSTQRSLEAVERARRFCDEHLAGEYELEVIDIYEAPERASKAQIVAAPTLVKERPPPPRRVIGDLSDEGRLLSALGLTTAP